MVRFGWWPGQTPATSSIPGAQDMATKLVRRFGKPSVPSWQVLPWFLAVVGLCLLPSDYRAGGEIAHGHSLFQLWADSADGIVEHHHQTGSLGIIAASSHDWLDPLIPDAGMAEESSAAGHRADLADQHDSAPASSGIHLLLVGLAIPFGLDGSRVMVFGHGQSMVGRVTRILSPPPRRQMASV